MVFLNLHNDYFPYWSIWIGMVKIRNSGPHSLEVKAWLEDCSHPIDSQVCMHYHVTIKCDKSSETRDEKWYHGSLLWSHSLDSLATIYLIALNKESVDMENWCLGMALSHEAALKKKHRGHTLVGAPKGTSHCCCDTKGWLYPTSFGLWPCEWAYWQCYHCQYFCAVNVSIFLCISILALIHNAWLLFCYCAAI